MPVRQNFWKPASPKGLTFLFPCQPMPQLRGSSNKTKKGELLQVPHSNSGNTSVRQPFGLASVLQVRNVICGHPNLFVACFVCRNTVVLEVIA